MGVALDVRPLHLQGREPEELAPNVTIHESRDLHESYGLAMRGRVRALALAVAQSLALLAAAAVALGSLATWMTWMTWNRSSTGRGTEVIYESNNADHPVVMSPADLRAFASTGRGGFAYELNQVANFTRACLSSHDGIIIPLSPNQQTGAGDHGGGDRGAGVFKEDGWLRLARGMPTVLLPRVMEFEDFVKLRNVKHVRGAAAAVNCFRCDLSCRNPAHHLMGYTDLFLGGLLRTVPRLASLVFHQCPHRRSYDLAALYVHCARAVLAVCVLCCLSSVAGS